jgi:choice-of-anchor B domain-containing protein
MHPISRGMSSLVLFFALAVLTAPSLLAQSGTFGNSVVVTADELVVGEPTNNFRPGTVYVYGRSGSGWEETAQLRAPNPERADGFGTVLARTGNTLIIGQREGPLHTFERQGSEWTFSGVIEGTDDIGIQRAVDDEPSPWGNIHEIQLGCNQYGYCTADFRISLAAEGDWLLVGDPRGEGEGGGGGHADAIGGVAPEGAGSVHAFRRGADGTWTLEATLQAAEGMANDRFGETIAISGGRALIGAPDHVAMDGQEIEAAGRVYEFVLEDGEWREIGPIESRPERDANFGAAIAMAGSRAVVGAPGAGDGYGAAYLYDWDESSEVWVERSRLTAFTGLRGDRFGSSVSIEGDAIWVGAPAPHGIATGQVYVFGGAGGDPLLRSPDRIRLEGTVERDGFGGRIFSADGIVAVSALGMHHGAGSVHVYESGAGPDWGNGEMLVSPPDAMAALVGEERICEDGWIGEFECDEVDLLAFVPISMLRAPEHSRGVRTNDNWGWTDPQTGREYALVGRNDGVSFVDVTEPTNPVLVGDLPKSADTPPSQLWRDIKTYRNVAYIVADGAGDHGMQVFDLTRLRDVSNPPAMFEPDLTYRGEGSYRVGSSHNVWVNEETGFAYLIGGSCGGVHMVDINEPMSPSFAGCMDEGSTHDLECVVYHGPDERYQGSEICFRSAANRLIISDVTDKQNPVQLASATHPNPGYMHQGFTTPDHRYHYMNDENDVNLGHVETTRTLVWDLADLEDPQIALEFMGSMPASAHNLYLVDDIMYQANYRYGLHLVDVSDPLDPEEIGYFNTTPYLSGPGFSGAWSNYPFFESGTIVVTSLQEGLFLLRKRDPAVVF